MLGLGSAALVACGGGSNTLGPPGGSDGGAHETGAPDANSSDSPAILSDGGDGAAEVSVPLTVQIGPPAAPGQDLVVGGAVSKSASYTLFSTIGEGPGGNGVMASPNHKLIAGLLGTTTTRP